MQNPLYRLIAACLFVVPLSHGLVQPSLAPTPPMGWNSWNHFYANVNDADVRAAADAIVADGMRDAGYVYVNIDDGWQGSRLPGGTIQSNARFPDMKALADYVHARGLKLGIYSSPGPKTCAKFEGSYGHEQQDARTYAAWGVDYLKYDLCSYGEILRKAGNGDAAAAFALQKEAYRKMYDALVATCRPIVVSLCQYGMNSVWQWGPEVGGNLWRTTGDISDKYDRMSLIGFQQAGLARYARPGLPGNDDSGAMSSWYAFGRRGFYPNARQEVYLIGGPRYPWVKLKLANGHTFTIETVDGGIDRPYIRSATWDGVPFNQVWFTHEQLMRGGTLRFVMSDKPTDWGVDSHPPSLSDSNINVAGQLSTHRGGQQ